MRIWLFNPYGPLPDEGWRDYSYIMIGAALAQAGHDVTWWTSNFSHHFKTFRSSGWEDRQIAPGLKVRLVPTPGYRRNVGPGRFIRDALFGLRAFRRARKLPPPDVVITSEPATMGGYAGVRIARQTGAALIYDQMDLWPELMVQILPKWARIIGHAAFWPVYQYRRRMFAGLDGALALAKPYLESIIDARTGRPEIPKLVIYNGIDVPAFRRAMEVPLTDDMCVHFDRQGLKAIFAGSLGPSYDVEAMIAAATMLADVRSDTTIYIAGDGPARTRVASAAQKCRNLVYLGKLSPDVLPSVYAHCDVGLSCYSAQSNVEMCDKFYDYTAAGLVIINSLNGEVRDWIADASLGIQYEGGHASSLMHALVTVEADPYGTKAWRSASWDIGMRFDRTVQHAQLSQWVENVIISRDTKLQIQPV